MSKAKLESADSPFRFEFKKNALDRLLKKRPEGTRKQWTYSDTKETGLSVLVSTTSAAGRDAKLTFRCCYFLKNRPGKPNYIRLGSYPHEIGDPNEARDRARETRIAAKRDGIDPKRPPLPDRFDELVPEFIDNKNEKKEWQETERLFTTYILPEWKNLRMGEIDRPEINALIDKIATKKIKGSNGRFYGGKTTADKCLAVISSMMTWFAKSQKTTEYTKPILKDLRKTNPAERKRRRHLNGFEIRALWKATGEIGVYGALVRVLLLTGQRLRKVQQMRRAEIKERMLIEGRELDGRWMDDFWIENVWNPIKEDDAENKSASLVPLSEAAFNIINAIPIINADNDDHEDYVFSLNGRKPINAFSKGKAELDKRMREELKAMQALPENERADPDLFSLKPWVLHDLRRTATTLMGRAGVDSDIRERCLGHVIGGIRGNYDMHDFILEKRDAFARLAAHVERIINPPERANVVDLAAKRAAE